jgi:predicted regulator of Ras-like GTPase activity (Roadblock/LC7/MglB family)
VTRELWRLRFDSPKRGRIRLIGAGRRRRLIPLMRFRSEGESIVLPVKSARCFRTDRKVLSMANSPILIREQRYHQIKALLARLRLDASARLVVLVDKDGQQIAVHGELGELDTTSLASLAAGNVAATGGMAKLIGEREFPTLSHEGERESIHISVIGRVLLLVVFDDRSSLGLVKLRSKQVSQELAQAFADVERDSQLSAADGSLPFGEITDEEIDSLFSQP